MSPNRKEVTNMQIWIAAVSGFEYAAPHFSDKAEAKKFAEECWKQLATDSDRAEMVAEEGSKCPSYESIGWVEDGSQYATPGTEWLTIFQTYEFPATKNHPAMGQQIRCDTEHFIEEVRVYETAEEALKA
jgi:hypothetical protein